MVRKIMSLSVCRRSAVCAALLAGVVSAACAASELPAPLKKAAQRWKVNESAVAIAVVPVDSVRRTASGSNVAQVKPLLVYRADALGSVKS